MNGLFAAAAEIQRFVDERNWRCCIIGGLAVVRWGEPRATQDVDISLFTGFGSEARYVDELLAHFAGRIPDARQFALDNRVLLARASNGVSFDIALAGFPYEEQFMQRASRFEFAPGVELTTASAEDLVVLKAFAGRDRDWADVDGIVVRRAGHLDWPYIVKSLTALCAARDDAQTPARLQQLRQRHGI